MINVTKTFLPPQNEYNEILKRAWDATWITNRGALLKELESKLLNYLEVPHIIATTNGTLPLQIAIKALSLQGEIITTPFSYVATTASISWEGCTPVFVDIHPEYFTIDETKIEAVITSKTSAILATHVFGNPCHIAAIEAIAKKHKLKVIYDAAHCFGVRYENSSIFTYGDVSTCSFHATKLFHTGEGGAVFTNDPELHETLFYHHNFGHKGKHEFHGLGINAKMSELHAAMGLAVLPYMEMILQKRKAVVERYRELLQGTQLAFMKIREHTHWNYSYFPVLFPSEADLHAAQERLANVAVYPRRYFYPSLHSLPYVESGAMPISETVSSRILCLPLAHDLSADNLKLIVDNIK